MKQAFIKIAGLFLLLFISSTAFAAGLGDIQVKSSLNQPLNATIPIVDLGSVPFAAVKVRLASSKEFAAVGLARDLNLLNLQFNVQQNKQQQFYIQVSSSQPIDQPVLTFLLQLYWPNGKILREYTVFLDPANYPTAAQNVAPTKASTKRVKATSSASTPSIYGPTTRFDNLWEIAQRFAPSRQASPAQMMVAILQLNPSAFFKNNINGLKQGYRLILPTSAQAKAISNDYAEQLITKQNNAWQMQTQTTVLPTRRDTKPADVADNENSDEEVNITVVTPVSRQSAGQQIPSIIKGENNPEPIPVPASAPSSIRSSANTPPPIVLLPTPDASLSTLAETGSSLTLLQPNVPPASLASNQTIEILKIANQSLQMEVKNLRAQLSVLQAKLAKDEQALSALRNKTPANNAAAQMPASPSPAVAVKVSDPANASQENIKRGHSGFLVGSLIIISLLVIVIVFRERMSFFALIKSWRDRIKPSLHSVKEHLHFEPVESDEMLFKQNKSATTEQPLEMPLKSFSPTQSTAEGQPARASAAMFDVVDEADVYIAYGRYEKAETLLKNSLLTNPQQPDLQLKLLEIYAAQKDKVAFDRELNLLGDLTHLSASAQNKLTKLIHSWQENNIQANSVVDENAPAPPGVISLEREELVQSQPIVKSDENHHLMEFEGDLSHLYTKKELPIEGDIETLTTENRIKDARAVEAFPQEQIISPQAEETGLEEPKKEETLTEEGAAASNPFIEEPVGINLTNNDDEVEIEAIQTRLDLAQAYIDMGDLGEARLILNDVVQTGNEAQKQFAQTLLERIEAK